MIAVFLVLYNSIRAVVKLCHILSLRTGATGYQHKIVIYNYIRKYTVVQLCCDIYPCLLDASTNFDVDLYYIKLSKLIELGNYYKPFLFTADNLILDVVFISVMYSEQCI